MKPEITNVCKIKFCLKSKFSILEGDVTDNQWCMIFENSKSFPKREIMVVFADSGFFEKVLNSNKKSGECITALINFYTPNAQQRSPLSIFSISALKFLST